MKKQWKPLFLYRGLVQPNHKYTNWFYVADYQNITPKI